LSPEGQRRDMESKCLLTLNDSDARHASAGLMQGATQSDATGFRLERIINAARFAAPAECAPEDVAAISEAMWEYRRAHGVPDRRSLREMLADESTQ